jgi:cell division protein FtsI/penicillin-binding protein 2
MLSRRGFLAAFVGATQRGDGDCIVLDAGNGSVVMKRTVSRDSFHPGSTAKPVTASVALERNLKIDLPCRQTLRLGSRRLDCTHPPGAAALNMSEALAWSCNGFFATVAQMLGPGSLANGFRRYDMDVATPSPGEQTALLGIGEWGVTTDLLTLALTYRKLSVLCLDSRYAPLLEGLRLATTVGTARLAAPKGMETAGKTGTSPGRGRSGRNALFAGWAPAARPRIVVAVRVPGGAGGTQAAPLARSLFEEFL